MLFYCQGNFEFLKTKAPFYVARFFGQRLLDLTGARPTLSENKAQVFRRF